MQGGLEVKQLPAQVLVLGGPALELGHYPLELAQEVVGPALQLPQLLAQLGHFFLAVLQVLGPGCHSPLVLLAGRPELADFLLEAKALCLQLDLLLPYLVPRFLQARHPLHLLSQVLYSVLQAPVLNLQLLNPRRPRLVFHQLLQKGLY